MLGPSADPDAPSPQASAVLSAHLSSRFASLIFVGGTPPGLFMQPTISGGSESDVGDTDNRMFAAPEQSNSGFPRRVNVAPKDVPEGQGQSLERTSIVADSVVGSSSHGFPQHGDISGGDGSSHWFAQS